MSSFVRCHSDGVYSEVYVRDDRIVKLSNIPFANAVEDGDSFIDKNSVREAAILNVLGAHPHIVTAKDITFRPYRRGARLSSPRKGERPHLGIEMEKGLLIHIPVKERHSSQVKVARIARFVAEIGSALAYAHAADICHRDIKPANVIRSGTNGSYILIDWGLAGLGSSDRESRTSSYVSRWYRSPELLDRKAQASDHRKADVWAFGVCLLEMFFSPRFLFMSKARSQLKVARGLARQKSVDLCLLFRGMSHELGDLLNRIFDVDPERRPVFDVILEDPFVLRHAPSPAPAPPLYGGSPCARDVEVFSPCEGGSSSVSLSNRQCLFRWLTNAYVFARPDIRSRSLFSAFHLCDVYVERTNSKGKMKEAYFLVGCASLALASALFDSWPLSNPDFCWLAEEEFSLRAFEQAVLSIAYTLHWNLYPNDDLYTKWRASLSTPTPSLSAIWRMTETLSKPENFGKSPSELIHLFEARTKKLSTKPGQGPPTIPKVFLSKE